MKFSEITEITSTKTGAESDRNTVNKQTVLTFPLTVTSAAEHK